MSLLSDTRFFLKKYLDNPVVIAAVSYIIYRIITKKKKKEALAESIKVIHSGKKADIIYDDNSRKYILLTPNGNDIFSSPNVDKLQGFARKRGLL